MNYNYLYKKLNRRTPLKTDCGLLCKNACCSDELCEEQGMYLFPGEEKMFEGDDNFKIEESEFYYGDKKAKIIFCKGMCDRNKRPLSCRIFPLFPYITPFGELKVIVDVRARGICPLYKREITEFNSVFKRGVKHIGEILMNESETFDFLFSLSRHLEEEATSLVEILMK